MRLPDSLRSGRHSEWGERNRSNARLHSWLEGPLWTGGDTLLFVDVAHGRVLEATDGDVDVVLDYDGAPNGLAIAPDGSVVIADGTNGLIFSDHGSHGLTERHRVESLRGSPFLGLNDLVYDSAGTLFVTDQGMTGLHDPSGRVLRLSADGSLTEFLGGVPSPNGIAMGRSQNELLLAVTRDNSIWRVPFDDGSRPFRVGRFVQLSGGIGPDGIALAETGFLFVAHLGLGIVHVFDDLGREAGTYETPSGLNPTNVALAENRIYVTEADTAEVMVGDASDFV